MPRRGGNWNNGANYGVFNLNLNNNRSNTNSNYGARSALPIACCAKVTALASAQEEKEPYSFSVFIQRKEIQYTAASSSAYAQARRLFFLRRKNAQNIQ